MSSVVFRFLRLTLDCREYKNETWDITFLPPTIQFQFLPKLVKACFKLSLYFSFINEKYSYTWKETRVYRTPRDHRGQLSWSCDLHLHQLHHAFMTSCHSEICCVQLLCSNLTWLVLPFGIKNQRRMRKQLSNSSAERHWFKI